LARAHNRAPIIAQFRTQIASRQGTAETCSCTPPITPDTPFRLTPTRFGGILMCLETVHHLSTSVPMSAAVLTTLRSILANPVGVDGLIIVGMGP
jgi:hypothetical protein